MYSKMASTRPVLSMPGSAYYKVANQIAEWLSKVPECKINSSTKKINDDVSKIKLKPDEELVSFDVVSLYTNVPVMESIKVCADLLFRENVEKPPVDRETFIELAKIASCNVIILHIIDTINRWMVWLWVVHQHHI